MSAPAKRIVHGRVLAFGTFDLLHIGHLSYLEQARKKGSELFVIVARDSNVAHFKGYLPVHDEQTRLRLVRALRTVDHAMLGDKTNFFKKIKQINPEWIAQGYDQWPGKKELEKQLSAHGIGAKVFRLRAYKKEHYKTTIIKQKIQRDY